MARYFDGGNGRIPRNAAEKCRTCGFVAAAHQRDMTGYDRLICPEVNDAKAPWSEIWYAPYTDADEQFPAKTSPDRLGAADQAAKALQQLMANQPVIVAGRRAGKMNAIAARMAAYKLSPDQKREFERLRKAADRAAREQELEQAARLKEAQARAEAERMVLEQAQRGTERIYFVPRPPFRFMPRELTSPSRATSDVKAKPEPTIAVDVPRAYFDEE